MISKVFKYTLHPRELSVEMPVGATIIYVASQRDQICVWAQIDPSAVKETVEFAIFGTGHEIYDSENLEYLGSVQIHQGEFIFHVYKKK